MSKGTYIVEKEFKLPIGHRLSCHEGRCQFWHGHNFSIKVGVFGNKLNDNNMIIDFSDLKNIVNEVIDSWDHSLFLNKDDELKESIDKGMRIGYTDGDPTSEKLSEILYKELEKLFKTKYSHLNINVLYVKLYETDSSCSIYFENKNKLMEY